MEICRHSCSYCYFFFFFSPLVNIVHGVFDDAQSVWLFWGREFSENYLRKENVLFVDLIYGDIEERLWRGDR